MSCQGSSFVPVPAIGASLGACAAPPTIDPRVDLTRQRSANLSACQQAEDAARRPHRARRPAPERPDTSTPSSTASDVTELARTSTCPAQVPSTSPRSAKQPVPAREQAGTHLRRDRPLGDLATRYPVRAFSQAALALGASARPHGQRPRTRHEGRPHNNRPRNHRLGATRRDETTDPTTIRSTSTSRTRPRKSGGTDGTGARRAVAHDAPTRARVGTASPWPAARRGDGVLGHGASTVLAIEPRPDAHRHLDRCGRPRPRADDVT